MYNDPDVTVVYVGTPHVLHHRNTKDALLAGKHVLLEKPACLEVEELDELIKIAKEKKLFFMEYSSLGNVTSVGIPAPQHTCPSSVFRSILKIPHDRFIKQGALSQHFALLLADEIFHLASVQIGASAGSFFFQFLDIYSPPRLFLQFRYSFSDRHGIFGKQSIHKTSTSTKVRKEGYSVASLASSTSPTILQNNIT
ncbi:hypothetical protein I315_06893 [Cryptococcus gattii Ru294]|nr:hypothetical protein I315_06893 [Cryptococcus gattii Ru294]